MTIWKFFVWVLGAVALAACGGGEAPEDTVTFSFRVRGHAASEEFRYATASPAFIATARAQLALPEAQRRLFISGALGAGSGGHNPGWNWHLREATLNELAMELCDGRPSMVEADLNYWIHTVKRFCPWASYVHAEVR